MLSASTVFIGSIVVSLSTSIACCWLGGRIVLAGDGKPRVQELQNHGSLCQFRPRFSLLSVHFLWKLLLHLLQEIAWSRTDFALGLIQPSQDAQEDPWALDRIALLRADIVASLAFIWEETSGAIIFWTIHVAEETPVSGSRPPCTCTLSSV